MTTGLILPLPLTEDVTFSLGKLQCFRIRGSPIEHLMIPIYCNVGEAKVPFSLRTPIFEAASVYTFDGAGTSNDRDRRSLLIENGACPELEKAMKVIAEKTFDQLKNIAQTYKDKLPPVCKRLLGPTVKMDDVVRDFFSEDGSGHWFKVHEGCKTFSVDTKEAVDSFEGITRADYKALIRIRGYYLGQQGQSMACCALNPLIEQLAMHPRVHNVPTELVLPIDDFETHGCEVVEAATLGKRKAAEQTPKKGSKKGGAKAPKAEDEGELMSQLMAD